MKTAEIFESLEKALKKLEEAKSFPEDDPHKESAIQRFEYTFELSWKLMNSTLKDQGIDVYGVKNIIRNAAKIGLIENVDKWFQYALSRNKASHIYREEVADEVYKVAKGDFSESVKKLLSKAKENA